jgi:hypothetical protein
VTFTENVARQHRTPLGSSIIKKLPGYLYTSGTPCSREQIVAHILSRSMGLHCVLSILSLAPDLLSHHNLLIFTLTGYKDICAKTTDANISPIATRNEIIAISAEDTVVSTQAIDYVCAGATND